MASRYFVNEDIRGHRIMLVGENGGKATEMGRNEAIRKASEEGLDLVAVARSEEGLPVCKIMDYGKFKYDQSKKKHDQKKTPCLKEMTFGPAISPHDLETKRHKVEEFLSKKHKVKYGVFLKGRQKAFRAEARQMLEKEVELLSDKAKADPIRDSGHLIFTTLSPVG